MICESMHLRAEILVALFNIKYKPHTSKQTVLWMWVVGVMYVAKKFVGIRVHDHILIYASEVASLATDNLS